MSKTGRGAASMAWAELRADVDVARGRLEIFRKNALRLKDDIPKKQTGLAKAATRLVEDLDEILAGEPFTDPVKEAVSGTTSNA